MSGEAKTPEVLEQDDPRIAALALEKELKNFSGRLPYDQARIVEKTQAALKTGVMAIFDAGCGMILLKCNEGDTYPLILEKYFPGVTLDTAKKWRRFARGMAAHPQFRAFINERGGYSKALTMLQSCTEGEIQEFEETGGVRGYNMEEISRMSVRTLQKALFKAKEKAAQAVEKATDKVLAENVKLREENEGLKAAMTEPDVQAAFKIIREAEKKFMEGAALLRKITPELLEREETVRNLAFVSADMLNRLRSQIVDAAQGALNRVLAAEGGDDE